MTEVHSCKARVEIYNEAKVFTDHFLEQDPATLLPLWVQTPSGQVSFDGDNALLTIKAGETNVHFSRAVNYNSATYGHILVRVTSVSNLWQLWVQRGDLQTWIKVAEYSTAGLFDINVGAVYSGSVIGVDLVAYGTGGQTASFDLFSICKALVVPDEGKFVGELRVTLPTLKDGVQGAKFTLLNGDSAFNILKNHDGVVVYLGRSDSPGEKVFGGRIRKKSNEGLMLGHAELTVWCHGHAYELNCPPSNLRKRYASVNGRTIIEEGLNLCRYIRKHPVANQWFDSGGVSGSTDDRITSTHSVEYDQEKPFKPLVEIADKAGNGVSVGFDVVDTPAGCLIGHLRGSLDFTCGVVPSLRHYLQTLDACQVKNRQTVYGAKQRAEPAGGDAWTLDAVGNWICDYGTLSAGTTSPAPYVGSNYLKCVPSSPNPGKAYFSRDLSALAFPVTGKGKDAYGKLRFAAYVYGYIVTSAKVRLRAPDVSNCFVWTADPSLFAIGGWNHHDPDLGEGNEYSKDTPGGVWVKTGSPDWLNITRLDFMFEGVAGAGGFVAVDGLNFGSGAFRATANNSASQALTWGVIVAEPESDSALLSDAECLARANSILENLAVEVELVDPIIVEGNAAYKPSYRASLLGSYRVLRKVTHVLVDNQWTSELTV